MKRFAAKAAPAALVALGAGMLLASGALAAGFAQAPGSPFPTETPFVLTDDCNLANLATGDLNNDGNLDVVVGCTDKVAVLLGDGRGALAQAPGSPYRMDGDGPDAIGVADFNGDGNEAVVVANGGNLAVSTLFGDGTGRLTLAPHSPATTGSPSSMGVADLNADGKPDVAISQFFGTIHVFLGRGTLGDLDFVPGNTFDGGCCQTGLAVSDFNRDGKPDVAIVNLFKGTVSVLLGDGQGHFSPAPGSPVPTGGSQPVRVGAADFNGDGAPDLAIANYTNTSVLLGDGEGGMHPATGSPFTVPAIAPQSLATGDFNRDGRPDVALTFFYRQAPDGTYSRSNEVWVLLGDGSGGLSLAPGSPVETGGRGPSSIAVGDFNGDARPDLAVLNGFSRDVAVLLNYKSAAKLCDAQRSAMGNAAFDERYGSNGNDANAYGKCVTQNKGF